MTKIQRAEQILSQAERELVETATAAAAERDYDNASGLLAVAREVHQLPQRFRHLFGQGAPDPKELARAAGPPTKSFPRAHARGTKTGGPKFTHYPKFERAGENLVKIAWSKADKSEYEHKSPKRVLSVLVESLNKIGANGKRFAMESVMPLTDPGDGSEIPPYRVYLCLAWLRQIGAVVQHGRQGYSLKRDESLATAVESRWLEVPER